MKNQLKRKKPLRVAVYSRYGLPLPEVRPYSGEQELLAACRMGQVDHLLVESIARLGRNAEDALRITRELKGAGVTVSLPSSTARPGTRRRRSSPGAPASAE